MAKERVSRLVKQVIDKLVKDLLDTEREACLTKDEVTALLKQTITQAYEKCSKKEKKAFFKAISLSLQRDKFSNDNPNLYDYLVNLKLQNKPMEILNTLHKDYKPGPTFSIKSFWDDVSSKPLQVAYNNSLLENLDRYVPPFKMISYVIYFAVAFSLIPLLIAAALLLGVPALVTAGFRMLVSLVANAVTGGQYNQVWNDYIQANFSEYMQDPKMQATIPEVVGFKRLQLTFNSFYQAIANPTVFVPLQIILFPLVLTAATLGEIARYTLQGLSYAVLALCTLTCLAPLFILNIPLFLYDLITDKFYNNKNDENNEFATSNTGLTGLLAEELKDNGPTNESNPTHFDSPINSPRRSVKTSVYEPEFNETLYSM